MTGAGYHMIIVKNEKRKAKITSNRLPPPESAAESVASSPPPPPERKDITCADNKDTPTDGTSSLGDSVQSSVEDNRNNETNADIAALVERYVPDVWLDGDLSASLYTPPTLHTRPLYIHAHFTYTLTLHTRPLYIHAHFTYTPHLTYTQYTPTYTYIV